VTQGASAKVYQARPVDLAIASEFHEASRTRPLTHGLTVHAFMSARNGV